MTTYLRFFGHPPTGQNLPIEQEVEPETYYVPHVPGPWRLGDVKPVLDDVAEFLMLGNITEKPGKPGRTMFEVVPEPEARAALTFQVYRDAGLPQPSTAPSAEETHTVTEPVTQSDVPPVTPEEPHSNE